MEGWQSGLLRLFAKQIELIAFTGSNPVPSLNNSLSFWKG